MPALFSGIGIRTLYIGHEISVVLLVLSKRTDETLGLLVQAGTRKLWINDQVWDLSL